MFATIDLWTDAAAGRSCRVSLSEDACDLELHVLGRRALTMACRSVREAVERGEDWATLHHISPTVAAQVRSIEIPIEVGGFFSPFVMARLGSAAPY
jgi:hypothetical protein